MTDETHDKARQSWVASANGHAEFPLQNLPLGVFSPPGRTAPDAAPRGGIAIGDMIFDLRVAHDAGLFSGAAAAAAQARSEEHTSELQSRRDLVCRLLLEKKKKTRIREIYITLKGRL